jgi:hypothetical protein
MEKGIRSLVKNSKITYVVLTILKSFENHSGYERGFKKENDSLTFTSIYAVRVNCSTHKNLKFSLKLFVNISVRK